MAVHDQHTLDKVLLLGGHTDNTLAAAALRGVGIGGLTLDISRMCNGDNAVVLFNKILKHDVVRRLNYLCTALVRVAVAYFRHLVADYLLYLSHISEDALKLGYQRVQSFKLRLYLFALHAGQSAKRHVNYRLSLNIGKRISFHQPCL